jgi:hypothetical protein
MYAIEMNKTKKRKQYKKKRNKKAGEATPTSVMNKRYERLNLANSYQTHILMDSILL